MTDRSDEARRADAILDQELIRYQQRVEALDVVPALVDLQSAAEEMRQAELLRNSSRLRVLTPAQLEVVETITRRLMNKFLHQPLQMLKAAAREGDASTVEAIRAAFHAPAVRQNVEGESAEQEKPAGDADVASGKSETLSSKH
jgi:glutamyl-tRNA reductase